MVASQFWIYSDPNDDDCDIHYMCLSEFVTKPPKHMQNKPVNEDLWAALGGPISQESCSAHAICLHSSVP